MFGVSERNDEAILSMPGFHRILLYAAGFVSHQKAGRLESPIWFESQLFDRERIELDLLTTTDGFKLANASLRPFREGSLLRFTNSRSRRCQHARTS